MKALPFHGPIADGKGFPVRYTSVAPLPIDFPTTHLARARAPRVTPRGHQGFGEVHDAQLTNYCLCRPPRVCRRKHLDGTHVLTASTIWP